MRLGPGYVESGIYFANALLSAIFLSIIHDYLLTFCTILLKKICKSKIHLQIRFPLSLGGPLRSRSGATPGGAVEG